MQDFSLKSNIQYLQIMSFLTAEWKNLALVNYIVDENILKEFLPANTEIDKWNGLCYISLVAFLFENTKVLGLKIPFHHKFEEVNLRFYVRHKENDTWKRGVVFIKEIVPKAAISTIANLLYKEHYETRTMQHSFSELKKAGIFFMNGKLTINGNP